MVPGQYTLIISGITDNKEHIIQKVWYLTKESYERLVNSLPSPSVNGMISTEKLERHGYEVMDTMGAVVLPQSFQDGGDEPTEETASQ